MPAGLPAAGPALSSATGRAIIGANTNNRTGDVKVLTGISACVLMICAAQADADSGGVVPGNALTATAANPPQTSVKIFKYRDKHGVRSFSDRAPVDRKYEVIQYTCFACNLESRVDWGSIPLQLDAFAFSINSAARKYRVDPALVRAVIHAESAFKPGARSKKGALGLMQLMPDTAKDMGVQNALSPEENIEGGVRYLAWLLEKNSGNTTLATAAYNAGPGAVERYAGIPPFEETQTYVKRVRILHDRYKQALLPTAATPRSS